MIFDFELADRNNACTYEFYLFITLKKLIQKLITTLLTVNKCVHPRVSIHHMAVSKDEGKPLYFPVSTEYHHYGHEQQYNFLHKIQDDMPA